MVFGLRTLARGVRGGASAVGGAIKAVAGGVGNVIHLAKAVVSGESKPKAQSEECQAVAVQASEEALRRQLLLGALLIASLTQAPQLLLPGALGAAAAKVVLAAKESKVKKAGSRSEAEQARVEGRQWQEHWRGP